jgi:hypothetical protein
MESIRSFLGASACTALLACGGGRGGDQGASPAADSVAACSPDPNAPDGSATCAPSQITFRADGVVDLDRPIQFGTPIVVTYDVHRQTTCGTLTADPSTGVHLDLFYMTRSGHTDVSLGQDWADVAQGITRATLGPFGPSDGGDLQLWVRATNTTGCQAWDSAEGQNFHFPMVDGSTGSTDTPEIQLPPVGSVDGTVASNGEQVYVFTAKRNRNVAFDLADGLGVPRPANGGSDARLTIVSAATNKSVFEQTTVNGEFLSEVFVPPLDGSYQATVLDTSGVGGSYQLILRTDIPCQHDTDCPPTLTCQALPGPWGWSKSPGLKCL